MAIKLLDRLHLSTLDGIELDLELRGPIVLVCGKSGQGKSFIIDAINDTLKSIEKQEEEGYKIGGFSCSQDIRTVPNSWVLAPERDREPLESMVKRWENCVVFIDQAEIVLNSESLMRKVLYNGTKSQFVIYSHVTEYFGVPHRHSCRILQNDNKITFDYLED